MNKKGISMLVIVAIIVIAVVVGGIAAYYVLSSGGGDNGGNGGGGEDVYTVENATSLQYEAEVVSQDATITYKWAAKNIGTDNMVLRVDILGDVTYSYILNGEDDTAWMAVDDEWTDVSDTFSTQWADWNGLWTADTDALKASWSGTGDFTYTDSTGGSVTITNLQINPELADSLFQPTT